MNGWQGLPGAQKWLICFNSISQDQKPHSKLTHSFTTPLGSFYKHLIYIPCVSVWVYFISIFCFESCGKLLPMMIQVPLTLKSHQQLYLAIPLKRGSQLLLRPTSLGTTLSVSLLTRSHWVILLKNIWLQLSQLDPVPLEPRHIEGSSVTLQESDKAGIINGTDSAGRSLFWPAQIFFPFWKFTKPPPLNPHAQIFTSLRRWVIWLFWASVARRHASSWSWVVPSLDRASALQLSTSLPYHALWLSSFILPPQARKHYSLRFLL